VPAVVARIVADGQIPGMAVAAFAQGFDVLQRGIGLRNVFTANPARHFAVQLESHSFVDLVASE